MENNMILKSKKVKFFLITREYKAWLEDGIENFKK